MSLPPSAAVADPSAMGSCPADGGGSRLRRMLVLLVLILLPQVVIYWPAVTGQKCLLPLDGLAIGGNFLPDREEFRTLVPSDAIRSDPLYYMEPERLFLQQHLWAGDIPWWNPAQFCGAPAIPLGLLSVRSLTLSLIPSAYAWVVLQLVTALIAGTGMYRLLRGAFALSFWPAAWGAALAPHVAFLTLWLGYGLETGAAWFPWILALIWQHIHRPGVLGWVGLIGCCLQAVVTSINTAAHIALVGLLWTGFLLATARPGLSARSMLVAVGQLTTAAVIAVLLTTPLLLPYLEYVRSGARFADRLQGVEERPPDGPQALLLSVVPRAVGTTQRGWLWLRSGNLLESAATGYAGLLGALALAPLAGSSGRHRRLAWFWLAIWVLALGWQVNLPGVVQLLRLPGLNSISHNRFTFVAGFAVIMLSAVGLEQLLQRAQLGRSALLSLLLLTACSGWCGWRSLDLPAPKTRLAIRNAVSAGRTVNGMQQPAEVDTAEANLRSVYLQSLGLSVAGLTCISVAWWRPQRAPQLGVGLALLWGLELGSFSATTRPMSDWELYYPRAAVLDGLSQRTHSRVLGVQCLPPRLNEIYGFRDVRGYDAVDPRLLSELLKLGSDPKFASPGYAGTQYLVPLRDARTGRLHPIFDLLNVEYFITRQPWPKSYTLDSQGEKFWVYHNRHALSRAFVPGRTQAVDSPDMLKRLAAWNFDPRQTAFVEDPQFVLSDCRGTARITGETGRTLTLQADLESPGMVVVSDLWAPGWQATVNGVAVPVARVNHALRGVLLPAGNSTIQFVFWPGALTSGLWFAGIGSMLLLVGVWWIRQASFPGCRAALPTS